MHSEELESLLVPVTESSTESSTHSPTHSSTHSPPHALTHLHSYGMIGLHCCGDLSASMCRMFIESGPRCRLLAFVGCCYNLLTTRESNTAGIFGFPLNPEVTVRMEQRVRNAIVQVCLLWLFVKSRTLNSTRLRHFNPVLRDCFIELFCRWLFAIPFLPSFHELTGSFLEPILSNFPWESCLFVLERHVFLITFSLTLPRNILNSLLPRLNRSKRRGEKASGCFLCSRECLWFRIYILLVGLLCFLTHTLGQLLETLIITDRVYYLQRHGANVKVVCAFERKKSPRCMLIQAVKNHSPMCSVCLSILFYIQVCYSILIDFAHNQSTVKFITTKNRITTLLRFYHICKRFTILLGLILPYFLIHVPHFSKGSSFYKMERIDLE